MSSNREIDDLFRDCCHIDKLLSCESTLPSLKIAFARLSVKYVAVCVASKLEADTKILLGEFFAELSNPNASEIVSGFLNDIVLARGYHALFNWPRRNKSSNMGGFYAKFGKGAKKFIDEHADSDFQKSADAFLLIGQWRSELVHNNLAAFDLLDNHIPDSMRNLSTSEVRIKYEDAAKFLPKFVEYLREYIATPSQRQEQGNS